MLIGPGVQMQPMEPMQHRDAPDSDANANGAGLGTTRGLHLTDSVTSQPQAAPKAPDGTAVHFAEDDAEKGAAVVPYGYEARGKGHHGHHERPHHMHKGDFEDFGTRVKRATHSGVKAKHQRAITVLGRIGWVAKGLVYGLIGGLCTRAAASDDFARSADLSPQGAFVLIGTGSTGSVILIVMAVALATYISWRFWEGITAQGSHPCYGSFKNFFSFRLSPLVSGGVYTAYLVYILTLIPKSFDYKNNKVGRTQGNDFTASWRGSWIGRAGLVILGIAFMAAMLVQLQGVLTTKFHRELRLKELRPWVKWLILVAGHIGFLGRAGLFGLVMVVMFRALHGAVGTSKKNKNTLSNALTQLTTSKGGRAVLFLIGFGLIVYDLFAVLNAYPGRIYPTPLPSEAEMNAMVRAREEKAKAKADKKSKFKVLTDNRVPTAGNGLGSTAANGGERDAEISPV